MKRTLIGLLAVLLLTGCTSAMEKEPATYIEITTQEAKEIIDSEELTILDVRTPEEYKEDHIEGAVLIPDYQIKDLAETTLVDKDEKILVYCRSGNRSKSAAKQLVQMGYTNIYEFGGIMDWTYGTVKED